MGHLTDEMNRLRKEVDNLRDSRFEFLNNLKNEVFNFQTDFRNDFTDKSIKERNDRMEFFSNLKSNVAGFRDNLRRSHAFMAKTTREARNNFFSDLRKNVADFRQENMNDIAGCHAAWNLGSSFQHNFRKPKSASQPRHESTKQSAPSMSKQDKGTSKNQRK